jgi:hypothetical protein
VADSSLNGLVQEVALDDDNIHVSALQALIVGQVSSP